MPAKGPETRDLNARPIAWVALGTVAVMAAMLAGLAALQGRFQHLAGLPAPSPGTPPIWVHERDLKERYFAARTQDLARYRWLDRDAGVVQLPIERAMALVVERGIRWDLASPEPKP